MLADIEPGSYFSYTVTAFCDLLDSFNSEFFGEPYLLVHNHLFYLLKLRLSGVYKTRGDSKRVIDMQTMISMPPVLGFLMGTLAALSIGAWYLGKRAQNLDGEAIGLRNGLKLAGISIGIVFALGIVSTAVVQTLIPQ